MRRRQSAARIALGMLAALVVGAVDAGAAPAADPVLAALASARAQGNLTDDELRDLRRDWIASARAESTASTRSRREAVRSVRTYTTRLARTRPGLTADRVKPALLSVRATTWVMLHEAFPRHEQELHIPDEVVAFKYYSGRGVQLQPFETFKDGLAALNPAEPDIAAARAIADRMLELSARRGPAITWEYFFPFGGPSTPWTSAISQSVATSFFQRLGAAVEAPDRARYEDTARAVMRSFVRPTRAGGVSSAQGTGSFYVMYSFLPSQRILNGHLQVLIDLNRYARATDSTLARRIVDAGIAAVEPLLPLYDTGAWSSYQPGQEADLNYHEFQTSQLVTLGRETGNETFASYGERFRSYTQTPPVVELEQLDDAVIFPADDGYRDSITVPVTVDKRARITLLVRDAQGQEVARTSTEGGRGTHAITWNGTITGGGRAPAGDYTGRLTVTDIAGNRSLIDLPSPLRVVADTTPPSLRSLDIDGSARQTIVRVRVHDEASGWILVRIRVAGRIVAVAQGPRSGRVVLRVRRMLASVQGGELLLRDSSGNELVRSLALGGDVPT